MANEEDVEDWVSENSRQYDTSQIEEESTYKQPTSKKPESSPAEKPLEMPTPEVPKSQSDFENYIPIPPGLPVMSSSDSLMNITPYESRSQYNDDYVMYSDSEIGSQNSLELAPAHKVVSNEDDSSQRLGKRSVRNRSRELIAQREPSPKSRRESADSITPSPKPKKRLRRRSNRSEASERSHPVGSGYALAPATGKVFRNLLILEESLREQVAQQRALRRKYLTFMAILCSIIASIGHHLYYSNYETSSPFRVILTFVLLALLITLILYYLSGEYQNTIVLPRKFLSSTNRGLRQLNVRLVKIKTPFTDRITDSIREFLLYIITTCLNVLHKVDPSLEGNKSSKMEVFFVSCQLQCQPRIGITDVKLVLNARVFNTDIREAWELYRNEFWIREGVRRRNNMMSFFTGNFQDESVLDKEKLLKKDKRERRDRKKSNAASTPSKEASHKLSDQNLKELAVRLNEIDDTTSSLAEQDVQFVNV